MGTEVLEKISFRSRNVQTLLFSVQGISIKKKPAIREATRDRAPRLCLTKNSNHCHHAALLRPFVTILPTTKYLSFPPVDMAAENCH